MSRFDDPILRFEHRLRQAIDAFAGNLRRHVGAPPSSGAAPSSADEPGAADRQARMHVLQGEEARLRRKARRNAPDYSLNRHIAVRRLLALLVQPGLA